MNSIASDVVCGRFSGSDFFVPSAQRELGLKAGSVLNYAFIDWRGSDVRYGGGVGAACPEGAAARL